MKLLFALIVVLVANELFAATGVYTNVNGMVLGLEFPVTNLVAGERLEGTMIISNASQARVGVGWERGGFNDTSIGNFVVLDDAGSILPNTLPNHFRFSRLSMSSSRGSDFNPGSSVRFEGDVVWIYSGLTNPGNYWVKAIIPRVPLTNSQPPTTFQGETPWFALTVTPRPEGSPPAPHVYADYYAMIEQMTPELRAVFLREEERGEVFRRQMETSSATQSPPLKERFPPPPTPRQTESGVSTTAAPGNEAPARRTKGFYYGLSILLLLGATPILVWRSRRSHP
jgi:hypothetical protein